MISNNAPKSDLTKVSEQPVKSTDDNSAYTVVYAPDYQITSPHIVKQTINYVDQAGKVVSQEHTTPVSFLTVTNPVDRSVKTYYTTNAKSGTAIDNNGVPTDTNWKPGDATSFAAVDNPAVAGYKVISNNAPKSDLTKVSEQPVKSTDDNSAYTVGYAPDYQISSPHIVKQTINYVDQAGKVVSQEHTATPSKPGQSTTVTAKPEQPKLVKAGLLPQTGDDTASQTRGTIIGAVLLALGNVLAFFGFKKKHED